MAQTATIKQCTSRARSTTLSEREVRLLVRSPLDPGLSFGELIDAYLGEAERVGKPLKEYRSKIARNIRPALGGLAASEITAPVLIGWTAAMRSKGYWESTINNRLSIIGSVLRFGVQGGALEVDVSRDIPRPSRKARDPKRAGAEVLSIEQMRAILGGDLDPELEVVFAVCMLTGMRIGEVSALTWGDLRFAEGPLLEARVERSWSSKDHETRKTKTGDARIVPVHPRLATILEGWRRQMRNRLGRPVIGSDLVCPRYPLRRREGCKHWSETSVLRAWHQSLLSLGIAHPSSGSRRLHATRHTFITQLLRRGAEARVVRSMTHDEVADPASFFRYAHINFADKCAAIIKLEI